MALNIYADLFGLGGAISALDGASNYRLLFATTPIDDTCSDLFYSVWWPRIDGDDGPEPPPDLVERLEKEILSTIWDDLGIWRHQEYIEHPALAKRDARIYGALRKWTRQFYEVPPVIAKGSHAQLSRVRLRCCLACGSVSPVRASSKSRPEGVACGDSRLRRQRDFGSGSVRRVLPKRKRAWMWSGLRAARFLQRAVVEVRWHGCADHGHLRGTGKRWRGLCGASERHRVARPPSAGRPLIESAARANVFRRAPRFGSQCSRLRCVSGVVAAGAPRSRQR
jgi:3-Ketosteroid 9alpha-hydroxylase C-terminal domain